MDNNNRTNETLLDFSNIFWGFIDQWKAVLLFSVIIALVVTGIKYKYDTNTYNAAVAAANENTITADQAMQKINETLDALAVEDKAAVDYALGFHSLILDKYRYQTESPIMRLDPNHTEVITITYRISGALEPSQLSSLNDGYLTAFNDHTALETVSDATTSKIAPDYVKELISFADPYSGLSQIPASIVQEDNTFNIFVVIPKDESADSIESAVTDVIKKKSRELSADTAPHTVETVSVSSSVTACNSVLQKQSDIYYSTSYLRSSLNAVVAEFNPQQAEAYNLVLQMQAFINGGADASAELSLVPEPAKPGISKKAMVLGFIPGMLFYLFAYIVCLVFGGKTVSAKVAEKITHKRLLGEYYQSAPASGLLGKLLHSPAVFNFRHRGKTGLEEQVSEVSQSLDVISAREGIDNILVVNTYDGEDPFTDSIKKTCNEAGLSLDVLQQADINDEAFKDVTDAVISVSDSTGIKQLYSLVDLLDYYRIKILGFVYTANH